MLPGGTDPFYRNILAAGHRHYARVEVWSGLGVQLETDLTFLSGAVEATLASRVARNFTMTVPSYLYPDDPGDLLAPFGNELRVFYGVRLGDGSLKYTWPVFRGRIRNVTKSSDGTCSVQCADRAADVADVNFVTPRNSDPTLTINEQWQQLVVEAIPDAQFGASDSFAKLIQPLTWEFERASAMDEMSRSVGALWYPLAAGEFVLRRFPWNVAASPVITLSDKAGGIVNSWMSTRSRDSIFNVVTVTSERLNGDGAVFATASDTTVGSPTSIAGGFGVRSRQERLQTPSTQGGAMGAAEALLRTYVAPTEEWTLSVVPDGSLELGDVMGLDVDNRTPVQVLTAFTLPIDLSGDMTLSTRSLVIGGVS